MMTGLLTGLGKILQANEDVMGASGSCVETQWETSSPSSSCRPEVPRENHLVLRPQVRFPEAATDEEHETMVCSKDISAFKYRNMRLMRGITICMNVLC